MANLRGGNFEKQATDAFHRLERFGVARHGSQDNFTHSVGLAHKREAYLRDIQKYASENKLTGKLNHIMSNKTIMDKFLERRMETLSATSKENYLRGYSSMLQGLKQANISINIDKAYFDKKVSQIIKNTTIRTGRSISNIDDVVKRIYGIRFESGVIAQTMKELGFRTSEAIELVKHSVKYIYGNTVSGVVGKGNHIYIDKHVSSDLKLKLELVRKVSHEDTYRSHFKRATDGKHTPHCIRFTYAKYNFEAKILTGVAYKDAMKQVSTELNHVSAERTRYYLARA